MKYQFGMFRSLTINNIPKVDFHLHTSWTDGQASVFDTYESACKQNLDYILFSEHARKSSDEWFLEYEKQIRDLPKGKCMALVGAEVRIEDFDGSLDCSDLIKDHCDLLIASVHRFPGENGSSYLAFNEVEPAKALEIEYRLTSAAIENPMVDIIGHLFGMSISRYKVEPEVEMVRALLRKAAQYKIAVEINSHYHSDPWSLIKLCEKESTLFTLGSDAHCTDDVGKIIRVLKGE